MSAAKENSEDPEAWSFGRHMRQLRRARARTQEKLAEHARLSTDTIRRLEHGAFSPSLGTLRSLCRGLGMPLSTLFLSYEVGEPEPAAEYVDMLRGRSNAEIKLVTNLARALLDELDAGRRNLVDEDERHDG